MNNLSFRYNLYIYQKNLLSIDYNTILEHNLIAKVKKISYLGVSMNFFITIFSGVIIFIISQYVLELLIKPKVKLQELYGILSKTLLLYHVEYINGVLSDDAIQKIQDASSNLLSQAWLCYKDTDKRKNYLEISKQINYITSQSRTENKNYKAISDASKKIERIDNNIITTYVEHK